MQTWDWKSRDSGCSFFHRGARHLTAGVREGVHSAGVAATLASSAGNSTEPHRITCCAGVTNASQPAAAACGDPSGVAGSPDSSSSTSIATAASSDTPSCPVLSVGS